MKSIDFISDIKKSTMTLKDEKNNSLSSHRIVYQKTFNLSLSLCFRSQTKRWSTYQTRARKFSSQSQSDKRSVNKLNCNAVVFAIKGNSRNVCLAWSQFTWKEEFLWNNFTGSDKNSLATAWNIKQTRDLAIATTMQTDREINFACVSGWVSVDGLNFRKITVM